MDARGFYYKDMQEENKSSVVMNFLANSNNDWLDRMERYAEYKLKEANNEITN